ncbi:MAG TPA: hypothetical protein VF403_26990 [Kofleriaceae bacterium]
MADDDRAVRERMAALEAEVKADADAQRARKEVAMQKLRAQQAEQVELRRRQQELVATKKPTKKVVERDDEELDDRTEGLGQALELAGRANRVKQELQKTPGKGEKSWIKSGVASMLLGPLGWLYAGSWREAVPASALWVLIGTLASKILPTFLLMPVLMVVLPLSGIAGVVYALQYNRKGGRQRLFDKEKPKQLKSGREA